MTPYESLIDVTDGFATFMVDNGRERLEHGCCREHLGSPSRGWLTHEVPIHRAITACMTDGSNAVDSVEARADRPLAEMA